MAKIKNIKGEIWKDAIGYEGLYQVSNKGRVKSLNRITVAKNGSLYHLSEKLMSLIDAGQIYLIVRLCKNNHPKNERVNILVGKVFKPNSDPINKTQVNHLDGDKINNNDWNLEWSTPKENTNHAYKELGYRKPSGELNKTSIPIIVKYPNGASEFIIGIATAARKLNIKEQGIQRVLNKEQSQHKGYSFEYQQKN